MKIIYSSVLYDDERTLQCDVIEIVKLGFDYLSHSFIYTVRCKTKYYINDVQLFKALDIECYDFLIMAE